MSGAYIRTSLKKWHIFAFPVKKRDRHAILWLCESRFSVAVERNWQRKNNKQTIVLNRLVKTQFTGNHNTTSSSMPFFRRCVHTVLPVIHNISIWCDPLCTAVHFMQHSDVFTIGHYTHTSGTGSQTTSCSPNPKSLWDSHIYISNKE